MKRTKAVDAPRRTADLSDLATGFVRGCNEFHGRKRVKSTSDT